MQEDQRIRILEREIFRLHQLQMEMPNQAPPFSEQEISQAARDQHWEQLVDQNSRLGAYQLHLQEQIGKLEGTLVDTRLRLSLDPLTGLLDSGELARLLQECGDPTHVARESVALILLEIDQGFFERCLGAQRCYWLIRQAAQRLAAIVEVGDSLGRWADAQFLIIIRAPIAEKAQLHERVGLLARRLTQSLDRPVDFGGIPLTVSASAGALVVDGEDAAVALERVRRALSHAKTTGTSFHVYGDELRDRARRLAALQPALAQARSQGQLKVFYQPIIAAKDGLTAMLETRLRWIRPQGVIEARQFVEVLEESGEILSLDEWVLEEACRQVSGLSRVSVSVNLSPGHLLVADLPRRIFQLVERSGLAPERVCIELSEMGLVQAPAQVGTLARELSRMGISVAIDGFGSRLSSLAGLPVRFLKLDAQLVSQLDQPECQRLCKAALSLAHQMGIEVIAKRVETPRQVAWLRQAGCDYLQGYLFSVPVPLQEVAPLVDRPWGNAVALEGAGGQA